LESLKGRDHLKDLGIDGRIIKKMDVRELGWEGVDWIHLAQESMVGFCEHCN
jgi:hypothetical protein